MSTTVNTQPIRPRFWPYVLALFALVFAWIILIEILIKPAAFQEPLTAGQRLRWWLMPPVGMVLLSYGVHFLVKAIKALQALKAEAAKKQEEKARVKREANAKAAAEQHARFAINVYALGGHVKGHPLEDFAQDLPSDDPHSPILPEEALPDEDTDANTLAAYDTCLTALPHELALPCLLGFHTNKTFADNPADALLQKLKALQSDDLPPKNCHLFKERQGSELQFLYEDLFAAMEEKSAFEACMLSFQQGCLFRPVSNDESSSETPSVIPSAVTFLMGRPDSPSLRSIDAIAKVHRPQTLTIDFKASSPGKRQEAFNHLWQKAVASLPAGACPAQIILGGPSQEMVKWMAPISQTLQSLGSPLECFGPGSIHITQQLGDLGPSSIGVAVAIGTLTAQASEQPVAIVNVAEANQLTVIMVSPATPSLPEPATPTAAHAFPLGTMRKTGQACPQTGIWQAAHGDDMARQPIRFDAGERMIGTVARRLRNGFRLESEDTTWTLVAYAEEKPKAEVEEA